MEAILSSVFKNSNARFIEFLPRVDRLDFGLRFDFGSTSLDGDGPKREQADAGVQIDKSQPAAQANLPSRYYLDDLLVIVHKLDKVFRFD